MGRISTTVEEQIEILQSRGLCFELYSESKAKEILLDVGYYRLGFYCKPFYDSKDVFLPSTDFKQIVDLYYLDADLRDLLQKYLIELKLILEQNWFIMYQTSIENLQLGLQMTRWSKLNQYLSYKAPFIKVL